MGTFDETVQITRGETFDQYQNPVVGGQSFDVPGCVIEPLDHTESTSSGRNGKRSSIRVFITRQPPQEIRNTDEVTWRGATYELDGDVAEHIDDEDPEFSSWVLVASREVG